MIKLSLHAVIIIGCIVTYFNFVSDVDTSHYVILKYTYVQIVIIVIIHLMTHVFVRIKSEYKISTPRGTCDSRATIHRKEK